MDQAEATAIQLCTEIMSDDEGSDEEIEQYEVEALKDIRAGYKRVVNTNGTYRCPFSPGKKKQEYRYKEIHAHATDVSKGKRGPEATGNHRALKRYLEKDLAKQAVPQAEREVRLLQRVPRRIEKENLLVHPWMGILMNIENSERLESGFRTGPGNAEIREKFKDYKPHAVVVLYDRNGHMGKALITFGSDEDALRDAEAFERSFMEVDHGRKDWLRDNQRNRDKNLYGWQVTKQDLVELGDKEISAYLQKRDFKSAAMMNRENERKLQQQCQNLKEAVDKREERIQASHRKFVELQNIVTDVENVRLEAEREKATLEQKHKLELMELQASAQRAAEIHNHAMLEHRRSLEGKMKDLELQCEQLQETEKLMKQQNEAERIHHATERKEAQRKLEMVTQQAEKHKQQQMQQKQLIKKHEEECKKLEMQMQGQRKKLAAKQTRELESQRVAEMLEIEKGREAVKDIEEHKRQIQELEEQLKSTQEEVDDQNDLVNVLTTKEREITNELEEARKVAVTILKKYGCANKLAIKLAGDLNTQPWQIPCQQKYKFDKNGWEYCMQLATSEWDTLLRDHDFVPYKTVEVGNGKFERRFNYDDERFVKLKTDLGPEVLKTVTDALSEVEEYNPSGRYVIEVAWNFEKNRRASMKDMLLHLFEVIKSTETKVKGVGVKRKRTNRP